MGTPGDNDKAVKESTRRVSLELSDRLLNAINEAKIAGNFKSRADVIEQALCNLFLGET